ncbi:MAG TPA: diguanylate cyclase [Steroidobacteraceae bacterium]|nr:diguanylate cyclase [Steroidobacteraceae bacterium]
MRVDVADVLYRIAQSLRATGDRISGTLQPMAHSMPRWAWPAAIATLALLGVFRALTQAEFALSSSAIIPVGLLAWFGGMRHGVAAAILAAVMWFASGWWAMPSNDPRWIVLLNGATHFLIYLLVAFLIARIRTLLLQEAEAARREPLTGLLNRRAFYEVGRLEVARAARYQHPLAMVFIDLDRFKLLNDSQGHESGDRALCAVADALRRVLRRTDYVARVGGDEFGVILPEADRHGVSATGEKLCGELAVALDGFAPVSGSIGIAWFERPDVEFEILLREADMLMYRTKRTGAGGFQLEYFPASIGKDTRAGGAE